MYTTPNLRRLGAELRRRRLDRGLTQKAVAERAQLSRSLVIRAEQGDPTVAVGNIERLLSVTGGALEVGARRLPTLDEATTLFAED